MFVVFTSGFFVFSGESHGLCCRAILSQEFGPFVQEFIRRQYPNRDVPDWVREALQWAKIDV